MILFMGTRKGCGAVEMKYRPERGIGWNTDLGGGPRRTSRRDARSQRSRDERK